MKKTNYRPGSMGEADAKSNKRALLIFAAGFAVIALLFILPIPANTHRYFQAAGRVWQILGIVGCVAFYVVLAKNFQEFVDDTISQTKLILILAAIMVFSVGCLGGWTFGL